MTTRAFMLLGLLAMLIVTAFCSGCASVDTWCDDHPVACPIVATVGTACVAGLVGVIAIKSLHSSSRNGGSTNSGPPTPPPANCQTNPALCQ